MFVSVCACVRVCERVCLCGQQQQQQRQVFVIYERFIEVKSF